MIFQEARPDLSPILTFCGTQMTLLKDERSAKDPSL
jgi:hypothetical protein